MNVLTESQRPEWERRVALMIEHQPIKPGIGRLLIARHPRAEKLGERIHKATQYLEQEQRATVVALGFERENAMGSKVEFVYEVGDQVMINEMAGKQMKLFGIEFAIVPEEEVFCRWSQKAAESIE